MKVAFSVFDRNKDGKISKDELAGVLKEADVVFTDEQLTDFMERVDKDGTHSLTQLIPPRRQRYPIISFSHTGDCRL